MTLRITGWEWRRREGSEEGNDLTMITRGILMLYLISAYFRMHN